MVAKNDILTAKREIEEKLRAFVRQRASDKVHVFISEWGHVRALIGSDAFKGMNSIERQELVWNWLRDRVASEHLVFLYGVNPMDVDEYDRSVSEA